MSVTITIILDTRRIKTRTNEYPVKLRVTFGRVTEYYQTIYDVSKEKYNKLPASRISEDLQILRSKLNGIERTAINAAQELDPFSFEDFEKHFIKDHSSFRKRKSRESISPSTLDDFDYTPFKKSFASLSTIIQNLGEYLIHFSLISKID